MTRSKGIRLWATHGAINPEPALASKSAVRIHISNEQKMDHTKFSPEEILVA